MKIIMEQEDFEARNVCEEVENEDGNGARYVYTIELTPEELYEAYTEQKRINIKEDIIIQLEYENENRTEFFSDDRQFDIERISADKELMNQLVEAIDDRDKSGYNDEVIAIAKDILDDDYYLPEA